MLVKHSKKDNVGRVDQIYFALSRAAEENDFGTVRAIIEFCEGIVV